MEKDPKLIVHTTNPINAEPTLDKLRENFITPYEEFYMRNHGEIPMIKAEEYRLKINGLVNNELELTLNDIKNNFQKRTVMATLQCAGNRREELTHFASIPGEVPWREGAIGNATWSGAALKEVLLKAGVKSETLYVAFIGAEEVFRNGENVGFGASIPIEKALTDDVLLAYEMNDQPLEPAHGFPVRVVVPGYIGARSVKWLVRITLQTEPSKNYFQDHAYKLFSPETNAGNVDWNAGKQLSEVGVNCVITNPQQGSIITGENILVKGFAVGEAGRKVKRVEISTDSGNTWTEAAITQGNEQWAWSFWEINLRLLPGNYELIARSFDEASNEQPEEVKEVWNFKGYMNNAWHRVKIEVKV